MSNERATGTTARSGPRAARPELWAEAREMRRRGIPLKAVAAHFGRSSATISGWISNCDYRERERDSQVAST